jgi:tryptophan-rich hypothetical protein
VNPLHPKKLLLTKWTAVQPVARQRHFVVVHVVKPEPPQEKIDWVDIEAVYSKAVTRIDWRELRDSSRWLQGWV